MRKRPRDEAKERRWRALAGKHSASGRSIWAFDTWLFRRSLPAVTKQNKVAYYLTFTRNSSGSLTS
jgi:hypothetical protein